MNVTIQNDELTEELTNQIVEKLLPAICSEVLSAVKEVDEVLTAEQLWKRCFPCYKTLQACRDHFLSRRDFPKIKRGTRTYYSLKQVNEYLKYAK